MGLGVYVRADLKPRGSDRLPSADQLFESIAQNLVAGLDDSVCRQWVEVQEHEGVLFIQLHPCAEPLEISMPEPGVVEAATKTSTTGPGYHAAVVRLLKHLGGACGLEWDWRAADEADGGEDEDAGADETGYALHGDFGRLQRSFAEFLQGLAGHVA